MVSQLDQELLEKLLTERKPVILKGALKNTSAFKKWDFSLFNERYGNQVFDAHVALEDYFKSVALPLKEIIDYETKKEKQYSLYGGPLFSSDHRLTEELNLEKWIEPSLLQKIKKNIYFKNAQLLFSNVDHASPTHFESGNLLNMQFRGSKRWTFVSPKDSALLLPEIPRHSIIQSELFKDGKEIINRNLSLSLYEATLEEGDVLFAPNYHWHFVQCLVPSISISIGWMSVKDLFKNPFITLIILTGRNPSIFSMIFSKKKTAKKS